MTRSIHITAIVMLAALTTFANFAQATRITAQNEDAYELGLGEVSLPGSEAGTVIFKACDDCKTQSMRVTGTTIYKVGGRTVTLKEFTEAAEEFRKQQGATSQTIVYVFYDVKSRRVNRLGMSYLGK
jgi:adenine deaminase